MTTNAEKVDLLINKSVKEIYFAIYGINYKAGTL
jgi:hypothetical protein